MKKQLLRAACLTIIAFTVGFKAKAQVSLNVDLNLWNPPAEYAGTDYYYVPDIESYYCVPKHQYVYLENDNWVFRPTPPPRYRGFNINNGYKVAVNRPTPYKYFSNDRARYARYKGNKKQVIIRNNYTRNTQVVRVKQNNGKGHGPGRGHGGGPGNGHGKGHGKH